MPKLKPQRAKAGGVAPFSRTGVSAPAENIGVVFGKFYPLHTGHIYLIQRACSQVDELHIIMGYDDTRDRSLFEDSAMSQQPTVPDRLRWLLQTFKYQKNIRIHAFNEEGMEPYPHGWDVWSNGIKTFMQEKGSSQTGFTPLKNQMPRSISNIWGSKPCWWIPSGRL